VLDSGPACQIAIITSASYLLLHSSYGGRRRGYARRSKEREARARASA
jgi:hypothetical protein